MSTVRQVVDQVYRDWLFAGDDQPVVSQTTAALTSSATVLPVDTAMLLADEQDLFAVGTLVEVDAEQMLVTAVSLPTLTVVRGFNGTAAAAHASGAPVHPQPRYARQGVIDAVADAVASLWPDLWQVRSVDVNGAVTFAELPGNAQSLLRVTWQDGNTWFATSGQLIRDFLSSTTKVALFTDIPVGRSGVVTYRAGFDRPSSESDDLGLLGVRREWERIVALTAAAHLIAGGPDLDVATHEFLSEQLARETFPPGTGSQLAARLLDQAERLRDGARRRLVAENPVPVVFMPGSGV